MATLIRIVPKEYRDSVSLMQLSAMLSALPGVEQASAVMATENNLSLLAEAGFVVGTIDATASDLVIVVQGQEAALSAAVNEAVQSLTRQTNKEDGEARTAIRPRNIQMALDEAGPCNMALISTPGEYAAAEALKALRLGLNVMLFSDNVAEQDELLLKQFASSRGLIVMGPDCGTAIVDGIPLAFANVVKRGGIGAVGASGTGLQEITVLIDRLGQGISQAFGTGGRDLHREIGGISMLAGLKDLTADSATKVIVLVSKPPAPEVARRILDEATKAGKPVVVNFLGADPATISHRNLYGVKTLEDAARAAVALIKGEKPRQDYSEVAVAPVDGQTPKASQRYIRGLFSGGTFCYEAALLLDEQFSDVYSNTPPRPAAALINLWQSHHHTLIDLGDDVFTRGRPHPMIDYRLRNERMVKEAEDPQTAVILLDVVLGYGSNADPAGEMIPAMRHARDMAAAEGRHIVFVGHVCGTDADPQSLNRQVHLLTEAGMILTQSNAQAVRLAASLVVSREPQPKQ